MTAHSRLYPTHTRTHDIIYGVPPTRRAVRTHFDAIIGNVVPEVSPEQAEQMSAQHRQLFNSV